MNRLEQLLEELCPEGVEYKPLSEILLIRNGRDYKGFDSGDIPVYGSGGIMTYIDRFAYDKPSVLIPRKGSLEKLYYVEEPFWTVDTLFYTEIDSAVALPKYVFYYLQMLHLEKLNKAGGVPSLTQAVLNRLKIPVPPLPIQNEIVCILDSFADSNNGLIALLTAELTAREKQFEYYRDKLLTPDNNIPKLHLSECCTTIADGDHQPPPKKEKGIPFITISNITNHNQIDFSKTMFVSPEYYERLAHKRRAQAGDILYTVVGSFGIAVYIETDYKFVFQRHIAILRPDRRTVLPKYLYHAMQATAFYSQADTAAKGAAQRTISLASLNRMEIPVPPLEEQARIVSILDRFDVLCNDLTSGLPRRNRSAPQAI
ncbi:MAG: restriction endonuclease subunit S [Provencibacterium sp.]|nr:restriction endonuclease subunit S [Provencibacterium sp.]